LRIIKLYFVTPQRVSLNMPKLNTRQVKHSDRKRWYKIKVSLGW